MIRTLTPAELASPAFLRLLHLAAELDDAALQRILDDEFPELRVLGECVGDEPTAFAAFRSSPAAVTLEYIAVALGSQRAGTGRRLVESIRAIEPGRPLVAETDDDAVDFYRRAGFDVVPAAEDPRWPGRARYECRLHPESVGPRT